MYGAASELGPERHNARALEKEGSVGIILPNKHNINVAKKELETIAEFESKLKNRVSYLTKEESKMMSKINQMRQKLITREHIFQNKEDHMDTLQSMKLKQFQQQEEKKRKIRAEYLRMQEAKSQKEINDM
jgi:hypothetical protein